MDELKNKLRENLGKRPNGYINCLVLIEFTINQLNKVITLPEWYECYKFLANLPDMGIYYKRVDNAVLHIMFTSFPPIKKIIHVTNINATYDEKQIFMHMIENNILYTEIFPNEMDFIIHCIRLHIVTSLNCKIGEGMHSIAPKDLVTKLPFNWHETKAHAPNVTNPSVLGIKRTSTHESTRENKTQVALK
jgi:hypothetical protein